MDISAAKTLFSNTFPQSKAVAVARVLPAEPIKPRRSFEQSEQQPPLTYSIQSLKAARTPPVLTAEKTVNTPAKTPTQNYVLEQRPSKASASYLAFAGIDTKINSVDLFV